MNRRDFLRMLGAGAAAALVGDALGQQGAPRLNFVFILADDYGWMDSGCYGSRFYETPNLDRLAAQGMRFTQAYAAAPVCSPTRASIQTGRYPARVHLTNYLKGNRPGKLLGPAYADRLAEEEVTIGEALDDHGYTTFYTGKWHLGGSPKSQGYQVVRSNLEGGSTRYFETFPDSGGEYLPDRLTDETIKFMEEAKDKPFFAFVGHFSVHIPLQAKAEKVQKYRAKAAAAPTTRPQFAEVEGFKTRVVQEHPTYAAMVESLDESVGRILQKLDELKIADRTVIIFMSDNGGLSTAQGFPTSNLPLRGGKGWLYEGGIREPLIVKWPGVAKAGSTCDAVVTSTDFFPTVLEVAGLPLLAEKHCDGVSFAPLLRGGAVQGEVREAREAREARAVYWHYPHYSDQGGGPGGAVRQGDWKLIEFYEDMRVELYNLKDDIGEKKDLARAMPERVEAMRKLLHDWRAQVKASMPSPNPKPREAFPELRKKE